MSKTGLAAAPSDARGRGAGGKTRAAQAGAEARAAMARKNPSAALRLCRKALKAPAARDDAELWALQARAEFLLGAYEQAEASGRRALALDPGHEGATIALADSLHSLDRTAEAIPWLVECVNAARASAALLLGLARYLLFLRDPRAALTVLDRCLETGAGGGRAFELVARAWLALEKPDRAERALEIGVRLEPTVREAYRHLGRLRGRRNDPRDKDSFRAGFELDPTDPSMALLYVHACRRQCAWSEAEAALSRLGDLSCGRALSLNPWIALGVHDDPAAARARAANWMETQWCLPKGVRAAEPRPRPEAADGRIRVGYFSNDFYAHATMRLMSGLLREHDRDRFELLCFNYGVTDAESPAYLKRFDRVFDIRAASDRDVAALSEAAGVDIAVDLKGFTVDSRSALFSRRIAPLQVNFLGYPGTMGAPVYDYIVGDEVVTPRGDEAFFAERIIRLPTAYLPNDDRRRAGPAPGRAAVGLPESAVVLACHNQPYKISREVFAIWMETLRRAPAAVLWLLGGGAAAEANIRAAVAGAGVAQERVIFAPKAPDPEHIARLALSDLFVDTWPLNAHTLASDAICAAGVPLLTKKGRQFAARVGASFAAAAGLDALIAETPEDYARKLLDLALRPEALRALRATLEANRRDRPLFDSAAYARFLETALAAAHARARRGAAPAHIAVSPDGSCREEA